MRNTQEYETLTLVDKEDIQTSSRTETLTDEEIDEINLLLYTKERFNISNEAYHELSMICKDSTCTSVMESPGEDKGFK